MSLITKLEVISFAFDSNFEATNFKEEHITAAEYKYIKGKLGKDFYNYLIALTSPTAAELALINKLKPALAYYVKTFIIPEIFKKVGNQGLIEPQGQNNQSAPAADKNEQIKDSLLLADTLMAIAVEYIEDNLTSFPLYVYDDGNNDLNDDFQRKGGLILY